MFSRVALPDSGTRTDPSETELAVAAEQPYLVEVAARVGAQALAA